MLLSFCLQRENVKTSQDVDELLMGMASQIAEREDNIVVEDLRGVYSFFFTALIRNQKSETGLLPSGFSYTRTLPWCCGT